MQLLFALGLLLMLVAGALWVRGFWSYDEFIVERPGKDTRPFYEGVSFRVSRFRLQLDWVRAYRSPIGPHLGETPRPWMLRHDRMRPPTKPPDEGFGFQFGCGKAAQGAPGQPAYYAYAKIPTWFAFITCVALTAASYVCLRRAYHRRLREQRNLCPACGYDLRGAEHERCPECGEAVAHDSHGEPSPLSKMK
jgi:hypothetical protein